MNDKSQQSKSLRPTKKLRIRQTRKSIREGRRSSSIYSKDSSVSNHTIITRQTVRTEKTKKTVEKTKNPQPKSLKMEEEIDRLTYSVSSRQQKSFKRSKKNLPQTNKPNKQNIKNDLETIDEVREEISKVWVYLKKTWKHFFLMMLKLAKFQLKYFYNLVLLPALSVFFTLFTCFLRLLLFILQICVVAMVSIYFLITYFLPERKYDPFRNKMRYDYISWLDVIDDNRRFLYINIETLCYITKQKPKQPGYKKFYIKDMNSDELKKIYLVPRPGLSEFLLEVS